VIDLADNPYMSDPADLRAEAQTVLVAIAGPDALLRHDQFEAIIALVADRRRALVVQRTGFGKSAVYWVSAALLRARGSGPTVVISPLLSLMRNQVAAAERAGISAVTVNSTNPEEWDAIFDRIAAGEIDVLLVSPERLNNLGFRDQVLPHLIESCGLLVIDEVHTCSDWGHDFRPDFRRITKFLAELPPGTPVLGTTATANTRVVEDVAEILGLTTNPAGNSDVLVQRGPLDRESLNLSVLDLPAPAKRLAWLAEHLEELEGSGIIYTLTVAATTEVADYLRSCGYEVAAYSGRTEPAERVAAEQALLENKVKALVATSALGMGFDKGDLGFVIHLGAPSSPISYYQQIGRAGSATETAEVILIPGGEDRAIWDYFAAQSMPSQSVVDSILDALARAESPLSTPALETRVDLSRSRLEATLKVLDVEGAVRRVGGGWEATGAPWSYDTERYARLAEVRRNESQAMLDYATTARCRMRFLLDQLDDPFMDADCGHCDNCTGTHRSTQVSAAALESATDTLARAGVVLEPHKLFPSGLSNLGVDLSGRIPPDEAAEPGRAVARFTDLGWGSDVRTAADRNAPDAVVPDALVHAAVDVMVDWKNSWAERPAAVVSISSRRHGELVGSFARAMASVGRLPYLGVLEHRGAPAPSVRTNSAQRVAALAATFSLTPDLATALSGPYADRPILLIDDVSDSGWTLTLAARELRLAGAGGVYPLVLGIVG
jgi:ATP-dependent DNA helicase RecQ